MKLNILMPMRRSLKVCACSCRYYTLEGTDKYADVVVVGGGMVGTSLACALASSKKLHNHKIVLLETSPKQQSRNWTDTPFENRVSSINPGSQAFLEDIGVWRKVIARRCRAYKDIFVWDGVSTGNIHLHSAEANRSFMAHMVENTVLVESCMERVEELSNVETHFDSQIKEVCLPLKSSHLASVELQNSEVIKAKLIVGADGPNSYIRTNVAQIKTLDYDYEQFAVVATLNVKCKDNANMTAWQRFLPTGPLALLPLSHNASSLVWSTTKEIAEELLKDSEEVFVEKINDAVLRNTQNGVVGAGNNIMFKVMSAIQPGSLSSRHVCHPPSVQSILPHSRGMFPLMLKHSPYYVKTRMALVGDAAHRIHPMAGLGVNLGFGDAESLVRTVESSVTVGEDLGSLEELLPYETERQRHNLAVMSATTSLHHLFSTAAYPLVLLRTLGLLATNNINPVKNQIIQYAMQ